MTTRKYYPEVDARGRIIPEAANGRGVGGRLGAARDREFARLGRILEATRDLEGLRALNNLRELVEIPVERGPATRGPSAFGPGVVDYPTFPDPRAGNLGARRGGIGSLDWRQFGETGEPSVALWTELDRRGAVFDGDGTKQPVLTPPPEGESSEADHTSAGSGTQYENPEVLNRRHFELEAKLNRIEADREADRDFGDRVRDWWEGRGWDGDAPSSRRGPGPTRLPAPDEGGDPAFAQKLMKRFNSPLVAWSPPTGRSPNRSRPSGEADVHGAPGTNAPVFRLHRGAEVGVERRAATAYRPLTPEQLERAFWRFARPGPVGT